MAQPPPERRERRWIRPAANGLAVGLVVLLVAGVGLYLARGAVGAAIAEGWLRSRGVDARIEVDQLSFADLGGRLSVGPVARPDLTIGHLEVDLAPGLDLAHPQVRRIRVDGGVLRVQLDTAGHMHFGQLQPLIDAAQKPTGARTALPEITIAGSRLLIDQGGVETPVEISAAVRAGRLAELDLRTSASRRRLGDTALDLRSAHLALHQDRDAYQLSADLDAPGVTHGALSATGVQAHLTGRVPSPSPGGAQGPVQLRGVLTADGRYGELARWTGGTALITLDGHLTGPMTALQLDGATRLTAAAGAVNTHETRFRGLTLAGELTQLRATLTSGALALRARSSVTADLASATTAANPGAAALHKAQLRAAGSVEATAAGLVADQTVAFSANASTTPAEADRLAALVPVLGTDPENHAAIARALQAMTVTAPSLSVRLKPGGFSLFLAQAVEASSPGGAVLRLSPAPLPLASLDQGRLAGQLNASLHGGGLPDLDLNTGRFAMADGRGGGDLSVRARLNYGTVRDARLDTPVHVDLKGRSITTVLPACSRVSAATISGTPDALARALQASLCPVSGTPLLTLADNRWTLRADLRDGAAVIPTSEARIEAIATEIDLHGDRSGPAGQVRLTRAVARDAAAELRFRPVIAKGALDLAAGRWTGRFTVTDGRRGVNLATATLAHDMARQTGSADVVADRIAFAPGGLQPGDLSYPAAQMVWRAKGVASFRGRYDWAAGGVMRSSGQANVSLSDFQAAAGHGHGLQTRLDFTSLGPLTSAPDEVLTVDRVESVTPLTGVVAHYHITPKTLEVASATVNAAKGVVQLDPMSILLQPKSTSSGRVQVFKVDLGALLQSTDLANDVHLSAVVAGVVPFVMTPDGVRVANGRLASVSSGRLSISRKALTGDATAGLAAQSDTVQGIAYQALENLAFDQLDVVLESRPQGRLGMIFHIRGRHDPVDAPPSTLNLLDLARGRIAQTPINIPKGTTVNLTLDTSINFDELMQSLTRPDPLPPASGPAEGAPDRKPSATRPK